jgi:DNA-directed RNA polymerase subunit RPC12/RpoP
MSIDVKCPQCGSELEAPDSSAGKSVKCPDCDTRIPVPAKPVASPKRAAIQPTPAPPAADRGDDDKVREERRPRRRRREDEDDEDDRPRRRRRRQDGYDDEGISTLIPYKNGKALAAYYCGVFSLIPCLALILGPIAFIFGLLGLRYAREHPRVKGAGHAWAGIILGALTTLVNLGVILLIVISAILGSHH